MAKKRVIAPLSEAKQKEYERQARLQYGPENVNESIRRWNGYSKAQQDAIMAEGGEIYSDLAAAMQAGTPARSPEVEAILERWQENLRNFYEPTLDILRGLGTLYNTDPDFMAFFQKIHPDLPPYLEESISYYVDNLETAEIERMLADDAARARRLGL
jgi:MerR family transcriptional regulator, thiopeptide resistance regulator